MPDLSTEALDYLRTLVLRDAGESASRAVAWEAFGFVHGVQAGQEAERIADRITLTQTCWGCPEQYDAYLDGEIIGYLRLRHGSFTVSYPWSGGDVVYRAAPRGDGLFEEDERDAYLTRAKEALARRHLGGPE
jgi:hypothetical protein